MVSSKFRPSISGVLQFPLICIALLLFGSTHNYPQESSAVASRYRKEAIKALITAWQLEAAKEYDSAIEQALRASSLARQGDEKLIELLAAGQLANIHLAVGDTLLGMSFLTDNIAGQFDFIFERGLKSFFRDYARVSMDWWEIAMQLLTESDLDSSILNKILGSKQGYATMSIFAKEIQRWQQAWGMPKDYRDANVEFQAIFLEIHKAFDPKNPTAKQNFLHKLQKRTDRLKLVTLKYAKRLGYSKKDVESWLAILTNFVLLYEALFYSDQQKLERAVDGIFDPMIKAAEDELGMSLDEAYAQQYKGQLDQYMAMAARHLVKQQSFFSELMPETPLGKSLNTIALHFMHEDASIAPIFVRYGFGRFSRLQPFGDQIIKGSQMVKRIYAKNARIELNDLPLVLPDSFQIWEQTLALGSAINPEGKWLYTGDRKYLVKAESEIAALIREAVTLSKTTGANSDIVRADLQVRLGITMWHAGQISEARAAFRQAEQVFTTNQDRERIWQVQFVMGLFEKINRNVTQALIHLKKSVETIEKLRATFRDPDLRGRIVDQRLVAYDFLIELLVRTGRYREAFRYVERAKARAFLDRLANPYTRNVLQPEKIVTQYDDYLRAMEAQRYEDHDYKSLLAGETLSTSEVRQLLDGQSAMIEYFISGNKVIIMLLTKDRPLQIALKQIDYSRLRKLISDYREVIARRLDHRQLADTLWNVFIAPIADSIQGKRLCIVPHGIAHYLPFHALRNEGKYLIESHSIFYLPSASVLKYVRDNRRTRSATASIIANPDGSLHFADQEADSIATMFPQATRLGAAFNKETVINSITSSDIIHFATHGVLNNENPMLSYLVLGKGDRLTVGEIYALRLNARLVTLSACNTNLGRLSVGDELVGLTRAFMFAGAPAVVASLWEADEVSTSSLMSHFYSSLIQEQRTVESLRQAQLSIIGDEKHSHPYFWAAFELVGDYF